MPANKQSMAGSLFQTLARLSTAVAYGVATAIFNVVQKRPAKSGYYANNAVEPFAAVFWFAAAVALPGVILTPFLRITTQGHKGDVGRVRDVPASTSSLDEEAAQNGGDDEKHALRTGRAAGKDE